ncbi:MAG: hypothetical protein ACR2J8_11155, partial [Thermomicrobiales bacterium]
ICGRGPLDLGRLRPARAGPSAVRVDGKADRHGASGQGTIDASMSAGGGGTVSGQESIDPGLLNRLFKAYDVRGIVPSELTPEIAYQIGRGLVQALAPANVAVGRDMRVSGPVIAGALIDGILDGGADVIDLGMVSSDALYFAVGEYGYAAGVMVTASHNPA